MRDIAIVLALVAVLPFILKKPWIGIIVWVVVSVLNPHRLAFGFAYSMPIAQLVAAATLVAMLFSPDKKEWQFPVTPVTVTLLVFVFWMNVTTVFALYPVAAFAKWEKVMKIMLMLFLGLYILHSRVHLNAMTWAIVGSIAFYGVKGGIFALLTGGAHKVYGPPASEIEDNNAISFACVMIIPLIYYLSTLYENRWIKNGLRLAIVFCALTVLASRSRGAFLALSAAAAFLIMKSEKRLGLSVGIAVLAPMLILFMPESWTARMQTIQTYEQDASSMGRINAWWMCFNLAKDRPLVGGGYGIWNADAFARWAPNPLDIHAAHSQFFAVLGEHGFVGLFLFLAFIGFAWRTGNLVDKKTRGVSELRWAASLGRMLQVSLIGYVVGGAFLSVAYFDVFYYIVAMLVLLRVVVEKEVQGLLGNRDAVQSSALAAPSQPVIAAPAGATTGTGQAKP